MSPDKSNVRTWLSGGQVHFGLQLETRFTEVTRRDSWHVPCRHRSRRCLSCWHDARCSWSCSLLLFHPSVRASLLSDNTGARRRFSNPSVSRGPVDAVFAPVQIDFYAQCLSYFSRVDFGRSGHVLFIFNWQNEVSSNVLLVILLA